MPAPFTSPARVAVALASFFFCASHAEPYFMMDYSTAAEPGGGWTAETPTDGWRRARIAGAGPDGQDVYELRQTYDPTPGQFYGGQFRWGWNGNVESSDPPQGAKRYYRWRMSFSPDSNFRTFDWGDGTSPSTMTNKVLIVGDGCGDRCRVILEYRGEPDARNLARLRLQLDGGVDPAVSGPWPLGQWLNIQIEVDSSSTSSTPDGGYRLWINNDNYDSPTAQRMGITLRTVNWRFVRLGAYVSNGLTQDGTHTIRLTDFQADTSFEPNWNSVAPTPPLPPSGVVAE